MVKTIKLNNFQNKNMSHTFGSKTSSYDYLQCWSQGETKHSLMVCPHLEIWSHLSNTSHILKQHYKSQTIVGSLVNKVSMLSVEPKLWSLLCAEHGFRLLSEAGNNFFLIQDVNSSETDALTREYKSGTKLECRVSLLRRFVDKSFMLYAFFVRHNRKPLRWVCFRECTFRMNLHGSL